MIVAETKHDRAARLVRERRLEVRRVDVDGLVVAKCRGDSGPVHDLGWDSAKNEWRCTCPANKKFRRECSHLMALKMVVTRG